MMRRSAILNWVCVAVGALALAAPLAFAQAPAAQPAPALPGTTLQLPDSLAPPVVPPPAAAPAQPPANTTVLPRSESSADAPAGQVRLVALLTADGQKIDRDVVWRVFSATPEANGKTKLINTIRQASPVFKAPMGDYLVNAAFGRANVTRKITLAAEAANATERFVLNAGGMRVAAKVAETAAPLSSVSYSIYSDRDQSGDRRLIIANVKPGLIVRLNSGIYHIVSVVGDANAMVESDVTVEAGKLTEANVSHPAAKATFKLVSKPGGEALAGTQWTIKSEQGDVIKESSGALPTHVLAPGTYTAIARLQGKTLERSFTVTDGQATQVEVIVQ
jgi:hypothetical protein